MIDLYRKKIVIGLLSVVIVGSIARQIEQERQVKEQVWNHPGDSQAVFYRKAGGISVQGTGRDHLSV